MVWSKSHVVSSQTSSMVHGWRFSRVNGALGNSGDWGVERILSKNPRISCDSQFQFLVTYPMTDYGNIMQSWNNSQTYLIYVYIYIYTYIHHYLPFLVLGLKWRFPIARLYFRGLSSISWDGNRRFLQGSARVRELNRQVGEDQFNFTMVYI